MIQSGTASDGDHAGELELRVTTGHQFDSEPPSRSLDSEGGRWKVGMCLFKLHIILYKHIYLGLSKPLALVSASSVSNESGIFALDCDVIL